MTVTQNLTIREAAENDYSALARIQTAANPDHPITTESLQHEHQFLRQSNVNPYVNAWLAERSGEVLGMAVALQFPGMFHPDRYHVEINVRPEYFRQGVGTALADMLQEHLQARGAKEVLAGGYEDQPAGLNFLERYGFSEVIRFFDNVLELDKVNFSDWQAELHLPDGLRAVSFAALKHELGDEIATRAFYDAFSEARADVPRTAPATELSYDDFRKRFGDPGAQPELIYLAVTPAAKSRPCPNCGSVTPGRTAWKSA